MDSSARLARVAVASSLLVLIAAAAAPRRVAAGFVPCSAVDLINAVQAAVTAGGPQTIDLSPACTYTLTTAHTDPGFVSASGLPALRSVTTPVVLTINGNGATITRPGGTPEFRFFVVQGNNTLALNDLTLSGGKALDAAASGGNVGGAIANAGTVALSGVTLSGNTAGNGIGTGSTGGSGGAIYNGGALSVVSSTFSNNRAGNGGNGTGGQQGGLGGVGGAIVNFGTMSVTSSLFSGNVAGDGGAPGGQGGSGGAIYTATATSVSVVSCSFTSSLAGGGPGTKGVGGAIGTSAFGGNGPINVVLSTFTNNATAASGTGSAIYYVGEVTIDRSTITNNQTSRALTLGGAAQTKITNSTISDNPGGGISVFSGTVTLTNVTVAANTGGNISGITSLRNTIVAGSIGAPDCTVAMNNLGNNLDTGTSCGFGSANGSKSNANAGLGPLQDNGGGTLTRAVLAGSDAIDTGSDIACDAAPVNGTDQRGIARPQGAHCDIGAFEAGATPATPTPTRTATVSATAAATATSTPPSGDCVGPEDGRISCWKGEGNAADSVDDNDGTLMNGATFAPGIDGQAFSFDGSDDEVGVPHAANLSFGANDPMSVSVWAYRVSGSQAMHLIGKRVGCAGNDTFNYQMVYDRVFSGGGMYFGGFQKAVNASFDPPFNAWTHFVATFDGSTEHLYINGVLAGTITEAHLGAENEVPLVIGGSGACPRWGGRLDEIQMYGRELTADEIKEMYETYFPPGPCAGPSNGRVSCWKGDGNASDVIDGNHGTLAGDTTFAAGIEGQAFSFDGNDDGVDLGNPANLNLQNLTIAAWLKRGSTTVAGLDGTSGGILYNGFGGYGLGIFHDGTLFLTKIGVSHVTSGFLRVSDTEFRHVAVTKSGATVTFYVDGIASPPQSYDPGFVASTAIHIGQVGDDGTASLLGLLDEVQVWNRALAEAEIREIVHAAPPPACDYPEITYPTNGSTYRAVCARAVTWSEAKAAAEQMGGHLATITSLGENDVAFNVVNVDELWYQNVFGAAIGPWLGAFQPPGSPEPGGGWTWVTGESFSFTRWNGGEPNNSGNTESLLHFYNSGRQRASNWNDVSPGGVTRGYIVEFDGTPTACETSPVVFEGNGHTYQAVCTLNGSTWAEANAAAQSMGGHLATITSSAENLFVFGLVDNPVLWTSNVFNASLGPWLGATQAPGAPEPGGFSWATGEPFSFTAWNGGEPSNSGGTENRIHYYTVPAPNRAASWNDITDTVELFGYIVEFDGPVSTATPTQTIASSATTSPTASPTRTATATATVSATVTATSTATSASTATPTRSSTATPVTTQTPTLTASHTQAATVTQTASRTPTRTPTSTASTTTTPSRTPTGTRTPTPPPTTTASITPTAPAGFFTLAGQVLRPRQTGVVILRGQEPVVGAVVEVVRCERDRRGICLRTPGAPVATAVTNQQGRFVLQIPVAVLGDGLLMLSVTIDGQSATKFRNVVVILQIPGAGGGAGQLDEDIIVDAVSEAGVQLLDEEGLGNFTDAGAAEVLAAVDAANADANFDGVGDNEAVAMAVKTAEEDPAVQAAIDENREVPCGGDCDGATTVTVDEIIRGVNIALGTTPVGDCPAFDIDGGDTVTVDEIVTAVNNALSGCS